MVSPWSPGGSLNCALFSPKKLFSPASRGALEKGDASFQLLHSAYGLSADSPASKMLAATFLSTKRGLPPDRQFVHMHSTLIDAGLELENWSG